MNFEFRGISIEVSEGKQAYIRYEKDYHVLLEQIKKKFIDTYKANMNVDTYLAQYMDIIEELEYDVYQMMAELLQKYGDFAFSLDDFGELYQEYIYQCFENYLKEMSIEIGKITGRREELKEYRQQRKDNRARWYGLGSQGRTKASIRNMESYMLHSTRNLVGNAATSVSTTIQLNQVIKNSERLEKMSAQIETFAEKGKIFMYNVLSSEEKRPFVLITRDELENARKHMDIVNNTEVNSDDNLQAIKQIIELYPGLIDVYKYMIEHYGDSQGEILDLARLVGTDLEGWKIQKLTNKLATNTPQDISNEEKLLDAISYIQSECEFWGLEPSEYTKELRLKWEELDRKLRTVEGKEYEKREEAEIAKEDLRFLYKFSFEQNLLDNSLDEFVPQLEVLLKSPEYQKNVKEKLTLLAKQQNLRNIQQSTFDLLSSMSIYKDIANDFDVGHIFSHKVGYEKFQDILEDNEKVAFVYDNALLIKGNHGILLTNQSLYYYKQKEITKIPLNELDKICIRNGEICIEYIDGQAIATEIKLEIDQIEYIFVEETLNRIVMMCRSIKNAECPLLDEDIYDNIILRSKCVEFLRHNKIKVGLLLLILAVVIFTMLTGMFKHDFRGSYIKENKGTLTNTANNDNTVTNDSRIPEGLIYDDVAIGNIAGYYEDSEFLSSLDCTMYSSPEDEVAGKVTIYLESACMVRDGELIKVRDNVYKINNGIEDDMIIGFYIQDNFVNAILYVNGEYEEEFIMQSEYIS